MDVQQITMLATQDSNNAEALPHFSDPSVAATGFYNQMMNKLKAELQDPKYTGMSDQAVADALNVPIENEVTTKAMLPPRTTHIMSSVKESLDLYIIYNGDMTAAVKAAFQKEIDTDPEGRGYKGLSPQEQINKMDASFETTVTNKQVMGSKINELFMRIPYAPNSVTATDVQKARV